VQRPQPGNGAKSYVARGYTPVGLEKVSQNEYSDGNLKSLRQVEDVKELYDIGADRGAPSLREPNRFPAPAVIPGFEDFTIEFFWKCHEFGMEILRAIAIGLGVDENYFTSFHEDADHLLRLIHYPAVERKLLASGAKARIPPHSDFGSITILFQDDVGGLQVEDRKDPGNYCKCQAHH
jgi:isopenicillin N synthase-like dioxygenase